MCASLLVISEQTTAVNRGPLIADYTQAKIKLTIGDR